MGELLLGHPLFPGETSSDQIEQIARIMGPPSEREVRVVLFARLQVGLCDPPLRSWSP